MLCYITYLIFDSFFISDFSRLTDINTRQKRVSKYAVRSSNYGYIFIVFFFFSKMFVEECRSDPTSETMSTTSVVDVHVYLWLAGEEERQDRDPSASRGE